MGFYLDKIKASNPDAYQKIVQFGQHQADANQGGTVGDWQAQLLTNLDTSQLNAPKTIPWNYSLAPTYNNDPENAYFTGMGQVKETPSGFTPIMVYDESGQSIGGYTKSLGNINGLPIDAKYDTSGNLTGYVPHGTQMNWLDANNYVTSEWDPTGKVTPTQGYHHTGSGGGMLGDIANTLGPIGMLAAAYFGGPAIAEGLGLTGATELAGAAPDFTSAAAGYGGAADTSGLLAGGATNIVGAAPDFTTQAAGYGGATGGVTADTGLLSSATNQLPTIPINTTGVPKVDLTSLFDNTSAYPDFTSAEAGYGGATSTYPDFTSAEAGYGGATTGVDATTGLPTSTPDISSMLKSMLNAGGSLASTAKAFLAQNPNILSGGLQTAGGLMQTQASKDAALKAQQDILNATQQATAGSQFRPVGVTTRFGSSNFQIDPATGQLVSAGYTAAPEITSAQNQLLKLGAGYLAQNPQDVAQQYMQNQLALLAPSREQQSAQLMNQLQNTGRTGLSVAQGGNLMSANPEMAALANARSLQDLQLAANAQQAGQQNVLFGTGLFGQAGTLENMAQQPFTLGTGLGTSISGAGANAGRLGLTGAGMSTAYGTSPAATTSPGAYLLGGLSSPTSTLGQGLANWLTSSAPTTSGITSRGMNAPTVDAYGNYVPLGYANY